MFSLHSSTPPFAKVCTASVDSVDDTVQKELASLSSLDKVKIEALKKRKLVATTSLTAFKELWGKSRVRIQRGG